MLSRANLVSGFDYVAGYDHGALAPGYYWFRKRQRVLRLIYRHFASLTSSPVPDRRHWLRRGVDLPCPEEAS